MLVQFEYGGRLSSSEKDRFKLVEGFCDCVMRENSGRAVREKPPLNFRQVKERWRDCVEESGLREGRDKGDENRQSESKKGQAGGGGQQGAGDADEKKTVRYRGNLVCFHYNNRGTECSRKPAGDGCDNGRGGDIRPRLQLSSGTGKVVFWQT